MHIDVKFPMKPLMERLSAVLPNKPETPGVSVAEADPLQRSGAHRAEVEISQRARELAQRAGDLKAFSENVNARLDRHGDYMAMRFSRASAHAHQAGHERLAERLANVGERVDQRLDRLGDRLEARVSHAAGQLHKLSAMMLSRLHGMEQAPVSGAVASNADGLTGTESPGDPAAEGNEKA